MRHRSFAVAGLLLASSLLPASRAAAVSIHISENGIDLRGDRVLIDSPDAPDAEISPGGGLHVGDRSIAVAEKDRILLERYNRRVRRITDRAIDVGIDGAQLGISALAAAVVAVVTGDHTRVEESVRPDADALRDKALRICRDVEELIGLQDQLAAD